MTDASTKSELRKDVRRRTHELRREIASKALVASGTVHRRTKSCGRAACKCSNDVAARHGPYFEWTRRRDGRQALTVLTPQQAALLEEAIANRRRIEELLAQWEEVTEAEVLGREPKSL